MQSFEVLTSKLFVAATLLGNVAAASTDVQITGVDHYAAPVGATITLTGTGLNDATSASMVWNWRGDLFPTSVNPVDANTLEVTMPDINSFSFGYTLLIETSSGSTIGIPSGFIEHTGTDPLPSHSSRTICVVRAGAVLSGTYSSEMVYVETGGVLEMGDNPSVKIIIAEDGANVDFVSAPSNMRATFLHSPDTIIIGSIPSTVETRQLTPVKASYGIETFDLGFAFNLSVVGDGIVTASPDQTYYRDNDDITLTAIPGTNTTFSGWSGDANSSDNPLDIEVDRAAINLTATFTQGWLLDIYDIPGVTISVDPDLPFYTPGQSVNLSATADAGYTFLGWRGDATGSSPSTSIVMDTNKQILPLIQKDGYDQLPQITGVDHYAAPVGATITLTGTGLNDATSASMVWNWRGDLFPTSVNPVDASTLEVTMPDINSFLFGYTLLVETSSGSTIGIPSGFIEHTGTDPLPSHSSRTICVVRAGAVLSGTYSSEMVYVETGGVLEMGDNPSVKIIIAEDGAVIDFNDAPSNMRATFLHSPDCLIIGSIPSSTETRQLTPVKASYGIETFDLGFAFNLSIVGDGIVTASPDQTYYRDNDDITLTAIPGTNTTFSGWSGDANSSDNPLDIEIDRAALSLTATFSPGWILDTYDIPGVSVIASPDYTIFEDGQIVSLTALVDSGYTFLGWGIDASGTDLVTSITMDDNKQIMPIVRRDDYAQLPQVASADLFTLPAGETITLTGTGLDDATAARMIWSWRADIQSSATVNPINANTLEMVMPSLNSDSIFGHYLLIETATGSTIGIPSGYDELTSGGSVTNPSGNGTPLVVRAGAVLSGSHYYKSVIVETGGVLEVADTVQLGLIIAEDGAVIDFTSAPSDFRTILLHSPDTVLIGTTPTNTTVEELTPIKPSYAIDKFVIGYPLDLQIEGPGSVTVTPDKAYYFQNESVELTAVEDPGAYFIRWIGSVSGHDHTITVRMRPDTMQIARFSTAPDYFSTWRLEHFTIEELQDLSISSFDADPDRDSITNATEYAFGTDPRDPEKKYKIKVKNEQVDGEFQFHASYTRPKNALDVTYQILVSKDLVTWNFNGDDTDLVYSEEIGIESIDDEVEEVTVYLNPNGDSPRAFFIKISAILFE